MLSRSVFRFGSHAIDLRARTLRSERGDVPLEPKVFDCLAYLIEHRDRAVGRDELISAVWGKADVSDAMLGQAVLKARRAIGDDGRAQGAIRTVPRFGYQWVAPVEADADPEVLPAVALPAIAPEPACVDDEPPMDTPLRDTAPDDTGPAPAVAVPPTRRPRRRIAIAVAAAMLLAAAAILMVLRPPPQASAVATGAVPQPRAGRVVLVLPMHVRSPIADDAWLRLGLLALVEESLRDVPGIAPMAADAAIAAAGTNDAPADVAALRARTRAGVVVASEAQHRGTGWTMSATVDDHGTVQQVEAEGADAVGTAAALADRIRQVLDPRSGGRERRSTDPAVRDLAARMQAALYAGRSSQALELADGAPAALAGTPDIAALRAQALLNLHRYEPMEAALGVLSLAPEAHWRATALMLRAKSAVERRQTDAALRDLRTAIDLLDPAGDRPLLARALSGLGLTQLQKGDFDAAEASLLRARMTVEPAQQPLDMARSDQNLGIIAVGRGRYDEATAMFRRAADTFAAFGMVEAEAAAAFNAGVADLQRLDYAAALAAARRAGRLGAAIETGELSRQSGLLEAEAMAQSGLWAAADERYATIGQAAAEASAARAGARLGRAALALERGDPRSAAALLEAAAADDDGDPRLRLRTAALRLRLATAVGDRAGGAALAARDDLREPPREAGSEDGLIARIARAQWLASGNAPDAVAAFDAALALARRIGSPMAIRDAAVAYARFRLARGELDDARTLAALVAPYATQDFECARTVFDVARAGGDELAARRHADAARRLAGERPFDSGAAVADAGTAAGPRRQADAAHP